MDLGSAEAIWKKFELVEVYQKTLKNIADIVFAAGITNWGFSKKVEPTAVSTYFC